MLHSFLPKHSSIQMNENQPEDGNSIFLRNTETRISYTAQKPKMSRKMLPMFL